jgi:hypothetical protein
MDEQLSTWMDGYDLVGVLNSSALPHNPVTSIGRVEGV